MPGSSSRRGRGGANSIPSELLLRSRGGSKAGLGELSDIVSPENCTAEVIDIVFEHLRPGRVPSAGATGGVVAAADRALSAVTVLSKVTFAAYSKPRIKEALVLRVVESVEGMCIWMDFALPFGLLQATDHDTGRVEVRRTHLFTAEVLQDLLFLDPRIHQALTSSPIFVKLMLRLWKETSDGSTLYMDLGGGNGCPIIRSVHKATGTDDGKEAFITHIVQHSSLSDTFATCAMERTNQIDNDGMSTQPLGNIIRHAGWMVDIADRFVSSSSLLRRSFVSTGYIKILTSLLNSISLRAVDTGTPELLIPNLQGICNLITLIADDNSRVVENRREAVSGDMMGLLARTVGYLATSGDPKAVESGMAVVKMFGEYTLYPSVVKEIHKLTPPPWGVATMPRTSKMFKVWHSFFMAFYIREQLPLPDVVRLCDNLPCTRRGQRSGEWQSKQCSRCSSVVYCSDECQKEDWDKWHKSECSAAREHHFQRCLTESWYTHATRAFHSGFIDEFFSQNLSEIENGHHQPLSPSTPTNEILPVIEFYNIDPLLDFQSLTKPQWWSHPDMEFGQAYLNPRLTAIGMLFKFGKVHEKGMRLVEAVFPMGSDWSVYLTAILKPSADGRYQAVYCVPRYGRDTAVTPGLRSF
ncbi:hypothetical protein FA13DRAFT_1738878 [Coprinellus micaceus]|uniref:phytol kinase n=1 Tax=Coprinellus micaceus TaxID=71717 RepID=A0A4Y7SSN5_COPMI|nr:hypothetical protein FA13DRAFT_1738878 [Coprinellus micaceus]